MKFMNKPTALLLAVSLIFAIFAFSAGATGVEDLDNAVTAMLGAEGYSNRESAYQNAADIYNRLGDEEKTQAASLYAIIVEVKVELESIKAAAIEFIGLVSSISDVVVGDRMGVIERAEGLVVDQTYPGVAEAKENLASIKTAHTQLVENCLAFLDAMAQAEQLSIDEYIELKEAIAEVEKYISLINQAYPGVEGAYRSYSNIISALSTRERHTEGVANKIKEMINAATYSDKVRIKNEIEGLIRSDNFIPDYEGIEELLKQKEETEKYMAQCVIAANRFILMVEAVASADNYRGALIACYPYLVGVDLTVDGAGAAKESFDEMVSEYNEVANLCNSIMSGK